MGKDNTTKIHTQSTTRQDYKKGRAKTRRKNIRQKKNDNKAATQNNRKSRKNKRWETRLVKTGQKKKEDKARQNKRMKTRQGCRKESNTCPNKVLSISSYLLSRLS